MASQDAGRTETAAYEETASLARVFEETIIRLIQAHDQTLLFARASYLKDPEQFDLSQWARDQQFASDVSLQIVIIDKQGMLAGSSLGMPAAPMDLSDREHFRVHVDSDRDELFISKPVLGRVSRKWSIQLSRRISAADGSFAGVILVSINPYYLVSFYRSIDISKNGMVLLVGLDGILRARVSAADQSVGDSIRSGALFKSLARASSGSFVTDGRKDGTPRLTSYRRVKGYPLVVAVGIDRAKVFAGYELHRDIYYGVAAGVSVLLLVFMGIIVRRQIGLQRAADHLWRAANFDTLTKLPNRNRFHELIEAIVEDETHGPKGQFAVLLIDVDNFKFINDTLTHEAGDHVLRIAAKRLARICRGAHVVGRLGGDEFAVVLRGGLKRPDIEAITARILDAIRKKVKFLGHTVDMSVSIGVACYPLHGSTWSDIFRAADLALFRAKQTGRNRAAVFAPAMRAEVENRLLILESARSAIEDARIVPFYQPQIAFDTGEIEGFEALCRIRQPNGRIATPAEFLPALEDREVGRGIGAAMLRGVIRDLNGWLGDELGIKRVALNASAVELRAEDYADRVLALLQAGGIDPERLEIEVTETAGFDDGAGTIKRNLALLAERGISIALDDFGTGFASLTHLQSLPIKKVKIDRSFVSNLGTDARSQSIVDAIVRLSHSLGKTVVAEGVESLAQVAQLRALECDAAQGFLFSKPVSSQEVPVYLLRHAAQMLSSRGHWQDQSRPRIGIQIAS
ncbi:MAG TPA: EAL domain-containing protein [Xanthobacteraceae bacterium]